MSNSTHKPPRLALAYAGLLVRRPGLVLLVLLALFGVSLWGTTKLTINSNQLDLISQDLPEVKEVKRVIDMVGGSGYLMLALRADSEPTLKKVADDIAAKLMADKEHVRFITYKVPVEFVQQNMALFIKTEDLVEGKRRIMAWLKDQLRRNNPFFIEIQKTEPVKLELTDLINKYSSVGKKSIRDDYYISNDRKMVLILIKPMWDSNQLGKTKDFVEQLRKDLAAYSAGGVQLKEDYDLMGNDKLVAYGFTGSYKTAVDDSYAIEESLQPVSLIAFAAIFVITILAFRKWVPTLIVASGTVIGTIITMGFTYITVGELNMITSILGGLLMGFGIDYGIHFIFRTRLELGQGKPYDQAIQDAVVNAGRPALVAAVVTSGSFFVLMRSEFRGFSQFGFLAGCGTFIIGVLLFAWSPALLAIAGRINPTWPKKLIGEMKPPATQSASTGKELRIPRPGLMLGVSTVIVGAMCALAIPWSDADVPTDKPASLAERLKAGVRFNYNSRALIPEGQPSVRLQDEISQRFNISSDPIAVYTKTLEETKAVYDELTNPKNKEKYSAIDQVVSIYTFVPPPETAAANAKILAEWKEELKDIDVAALPPEAQDKAALFMKMLEARPFDVHGVPDIYASQFVHLPETKPENHGYLTFIYPNVDLWDGKKMLTFVDQTSHIPTPEVKDASGKVLAPAMERRAAGAAPLFARLARIVLSDGKWAIFLVTLWILVMHFADFRDVKLALASVIPLTVGLAMMLGIMTLSDLHLNFMNIIILPILLGFGVSHGLYLLHRYLEGTSPVVALRSVGAAVASSTLTTAAGFAALLAASHNGLKSMGIVACIGLITTLVVSFTVLAAVMQVMWDRLPRKLQDGVQQAPGQPSDKSKSEAA
ncbi:RND family transporter [Vitiosangium sp. GDMCC 1.1324]|uniref:efflux RND transporter permease subunit n=1 Tax=Vitiosangium sp. (strain GDMCC 1.1324) TaxID=2138576 RepID=UPI000D36E1EB|nr:MMPL family transporter [Vitiosangium sp. GDMCC 1.1324]PTL81312.1 export protein [Vitiosangium sp. GDMCC 1.1324]